MEKNQRERLRKLYRTMNTHIHYLIYKIMCVPSFISRIEWRTMLEWLDAKEGERILDVACGPGQLSLKIAERGCEICGIDRGEYGIHIARYLAKRLKIAAEFEVGNAEDLPYRDGYFDKVVCSCSLEHFDDDVKALKEMYRVLKPGGSIVLTVDSFTYPISDELKEKHRKIAYVVNYYKPETLKERFEIAGFEMEIKDDYIYLRYPNVIYDTMLVPTEIYKEMKAVNISVLSKTLLRKNLIYANGGSKVFA